MADITFVEQYTMMVFETMASGEPIDAQRERRWPERMSTNGPKVDFKPSDENSDLDDEDGIMANQVRAIDPEEDISESVWQRL